MPYKSSRNSREDKSLKHNRFEGGSKNERPARSNSKPGKRFDDGSRDRKEEEGKRSSFAPSRGKRPFNSAKDERPERGRSPYRERSRDAEGGGDRNKPGFDREKSTGRAWVKSERSGSRTDSGSGSRPFSPGKKGSFGGDSRPFRKRSSEQGEERSEFRKDRPFEKRPFEKKSFDGDSRPFRKRSSEQGEEKPEFRKDRPFEKRPFEKKSFGGDRERRRTENPGREKKNYDAPSRNYRSREDRNWTSEEHIEHTPVLRGRKKQENKESELIRLNRYIANAGICSRRKADELIEAGVISVNGEVVSELGFKVDPAKDEIRYNGEALRREKMVYVLLNKPKDYITTTDDPQERRTVMQLVEKASKERIYPVGRLDRNTTGLLLLTNDGDLAEKLSHPRNNVTKIYQVELSKSLAQGDLNKISFGIELEDGFIKPDTVSYVQGGTKKEIGIQIHSGKNRIVRRIFEHLGYEVVKLDRVVYANLTKKDLPRGRWRYLEEKEVIQLKHFIK